MPASRRRTTNQRGYSPGRKASGANGNVIEWPKKDWVIDKPQLQLTQEELDRNRELASAHLAACRRGDREEAERLFARKKLSAYGLRSIKRHRGASACQ